MRQKKFGFETSQNLKELLAPHFELWKKKHGGDLNELAARCGVSSAYLSHVRRYGRVPSAPVLILLAFNLKIEGALLFHAAGVAEQFPYDRGLEITRPAEESNGLFSLKFNMDGFTETIRSIVRAEVRQRSVKDLLGNRPLRIGVNYHQYWMFESKTPPVNEKHGGLFPELCQMLGMALQKEVEFVHVPFANYIDLIAAGRIDMFGPTMIRPNLPVEILFSAPIYQLGISAVFRKRSTPDLKELPAPKSVEDLRSEAYKITVLQNSTPHLIVNTLLKRSDATILPCSSDQEGLERVLLKGIGRPAHIFVTNSITALDAARQHPRDLAPLFVERNTLLDLADNSIAIRPDWPELIPFINDAIRFVQARGGFYERLVKIQEGRYREVLELPGK